jgi:acetolactate synthase-1/2/3 large subunit
MSGNILEADKRGNTTAEWGHSAVDMAVNVRDFTKWDDQPVSLQHFAEPAVRARVINDDLGLQSLPEQN